jgi:hypothetical protein
MKKTWRGAGAAVLMAGMLALGASAQLASASEEGGPSIEGTYKFMSRTLADGTVQTPPAVVGLYTITKDHRNFNVYWTSPDGKVFSYSVVSTYKLTATEYTEAIVLSIMNDQVHGKELTYDLSGVSKTVPVTVEDNSVTIQMPFDPVTATFDGNTIKATNPDFTDIWERIP